MTLQANPQVLIEQLRLLTADPSSYFQDEAQKRNFQKLARQAGAAVEEPFETMQRLVYGVSGSQRCETMQLLIQPQPLPLATARIGQDRGIFAALASSSEGADLDGLAAASRLSKGVLECVLDYLCTQGMATESSPGTFKATQLTHMLLVPLFNDAVTHLSVFFEPCRAFADLLQP